MPPEHHVNVHILGAVTVLAPPIDRPEDSDIQDDSKAQLESFLAATTVYQVTRVVVGDQQ